MGFVRRILRSWARIRSVRVRALALALGTVSGAASLVAVPLADGQAAQAQDGSGQRMGHVTEAAHGDYTGDYGAGRLMAADPAGGYWTTTWSGTVTAHGSAPWFGSLAIRLNEPVVGMAATPDGDGYWLVASDGGIFSYGDAAFYGSTGSIRLNQPIVAMAPTPDAGGYWLVASDGGIFSYGDAVFEGSLGGTGASVEGLVVNPSSGSYSEVTTDGNVTTPGSPWGATAPATATTTTTTTTSVNSSSGGSCGATGSPGGSTPSVVSVCPATGPSSGGTTVTITGTNFASGDVVAFGLANATNVVVDSSTSITATAPAGAGTVDVTVGGSGGTSATTTADEYAYSGGAPSTPRVMVIMMENESSSAVLGNAALPYLNDSLVAHYPVLADSYAVAHPSLPNYLELSSGSTWGVTSDCAPGAWCEGDDNLAAQLDQAGISWAAYMESMPSNGYTGGDTGGSDGYGNQLYAQHHNPFVYYPDLASELTVHDKVFSSMITDLDSADPPAFVWVTPNMLDDGHDGPLTTMDDWLSVEVPAIQNTAWYQDGGHIVLTWDEGADSDTSGICGGTGGQIPGLVIGQDLFNGAPYTSPVDDAGVLGSIESLLGVPLLNDATNPAHGNLGSELQ